MAAPMATSSATAGVKMLAAAEESDDFAFDMRRSSKGRC
jgi:hypothetical protein